MNVDSPHSKVVLVSFDELSQCASHWQGQCSHITNFLPVGCSGRAVGFLVSVQLVRLNLGIKRVESHVPRQHQTFCRKLMNPRARKKKNTFQVAPVTSSSSPKTPRGRERTRFSLSSSSAHIGSNPVISR